MSSATLTLEEKTNITPVLLLDVTTHLQPYPFFYSRKCFTPELSEALLAWFDNGAEWLLHEGSFYEQWEANLLLQSPPESCASLLSPKTISSLRRAIETRLNADLGEKITVIAHKLVRGQAIAVHNDDPDPGAETHRLVVQINHRSESRIGGDLLVHGSRNSKDIFATLEPVHNSAFGFAMSGNSYHSVTPMGEWTRYSIVFSFWSKAAEAAASLLSGAGASAPTKTASEIAETLPPEELVRLNNLVLLLEGLGTNTRNHSDGTLLEHLVHTYLILRSWECPMDLATAGLFHSIYGTAHFREATLSSKDRQILDAQIGTKAENLAYLYGTCPANSYFTTLNDASNDSLVAEPGNLSPDLETARDLVLLDLANSVEQIARVTQDPDDLRKEKQRYESVSTFLPAPAVAAMRRAYARVV